MTLRSRSILRWEIIGAIFIICLGSALHFVFDWVGGWRPVALIAAVNESVWEHLKLAFWPGLVWAFLRKKDMERTLLERLAAKGFGLLVTAILIVVIFMTYTSILGHNLLLLDIGTFALAVLIGQIVSAAFSMRGTSALVLLRSGLGLLMMQIAAYSLFTFYPPDFWLFVDSRTGLSGIPPM